MIIALQFFQILLDAVHYFPTKLSFLSTIMQLLKVFMQCPSKLIDFLCDILPELIEAEPIQLLYL